MKKARTFHLEDLDIFVPVYLEEYSGKYLYEYPVFTAEPRQTGSGRPCVNAWQEACEYVESEDKGKIRGLLDCGSCDYYKTEQKKDLIGVCMCEQNRSGNKMKEEKHENK